MLTSPPGLRLGLKLLIDDAFSISNAFMPARCGGSAADARIYSTLRIALTLCTAIAQPFFTMVVQQLGCPRLAIGGPSAVGIPSQNPFAMLDAPSSRLTYLSSSSAIASPNELCRLLSRSYLDSLDRGYHFSLQPIQISRSSP